MRPPNLHRARERGARTRPSRSRIGFRARHRRPVGADPARRHGGRGAHHSVRSQQPTGGRNAAGRGVRARGRQANIRPKSCTETCHERRRGGKRRTFITPGYLGATILIVALFFFWGVSNSLNDVLIPQFRKTFQLRDFASSLVQFATFIGYFVFAIPASLFMRRFGYRAAVVHGARAVRYGRAAVLPGGAVRRVPLLPGRAVRGREWPVIPRDLGQSHDRRHGSTRKRGPAPELRADVQPAGHDLRRVRRQGADPLGHPPDARADAAMEPAAQAAWRAAELAAVKLPYFGIAFVVLLWAVLVAVAKFPPLARRVDADADAPPPEAFAACSPFPRYWLGVFAQFAYVGAQVGVWSFLIRYTQFNFPGTLGKTRSLAAMSVRWSVLRGPLRRHAADVEGESREVAGARSPPSTSCCAWWPSRRAATSGLYALIATSFFMSIQFPTIFTMSLRGLGAYTKSGLVVPGHGHHRRRGIHARSWAGCPMRARSTSHTRAGGLFRGGVVVRLEIARARRRSRMIRARAPRARPHRARSQHAGIRRRGHRQPVSRARRRRCGRRGARVVRRRRSLLRHRALLWFRAQRTASRRGVARRTAAAGDLDQGRPASGAHGAAGRQRGPRGIFFATAVRAGVRLQL